LLASLMGTKAYFRQDFDIERDAIGEATNFVINQAHPGDALVFHIAATRAAYEFYRARPGGPNAPADASRAHSGPEIIYPHHSDQLEYLDLTGNPPEDFLRAIADGNRRTWVILMNNGLPPNFDTGTGRIDHILGASSLDTRTWEFPKVQVRLYSRP